MTGAQEYVSGPFRLIPERQELLHDGTTVLLGSRAFELLHVLMRRQGLLVTKQELFEAVWPNTAVEESNLTVAMSSIRKALGCGVGETRYIATVAGRGYQFVAPVAKIGGPAAPAPVVAPGPVGPAGNLPRSLSSLIGRDAELAEIRDSLRQSSLVSIIGPGGIGKTRLSLAVGHAALAEYRHGVWLVELADLTTPELVGEVIAARLGLPLADRRKPEEAVATYLRDRQLLLILDNCEHLIDAVAQVAGAILTACPGVTVLATSQEALRLSGERIYRVPSLAFPAGPDGLTAAVSLGYSAVRLFVDRATLACADFTLTDAMAPIVAEICRQLDGIALAIELAAPRLRMISPAELLARLEDRFSLLTGGSRSALPRHQTLHALIEWSYGLLSAAEQRLMRVLSVFAGGWTLDGAVALGGEAQVFDLLSALVDKSLVVAETATHARRYRYLETTRAYAMKLAAPEEHDLHRRHADYMVAFFRACEHRRISDPREAWIDQFGPEIDNLRAGLNWAFGPTGDDAVGITLLCYASELFDEMSFAKERIRWFTLAAERVSDTTALEHRALILLLKGYTGSFGQTELLPAAIEAVALLRRTTDIPSLAHALTVAGSLATRPGDVAEGEAYLREAEALLRPLGPSAQLSSALGSLGAARFFAGSLDQAIAYTRESLDMAEMVGRHTWHELCANNLAELEFAAGRRAVALRIVRDNRIATRNSGNLRALATASTNLGAYLLAEGLPEAAGPPLREALELSVALGLGMGYRAAICLEHLARVIEAAGDGARAARLAGYGDGFYRSRQRTREAIEAEGWDALMAALRGRFAMGELDRLLALGAALTEAQAVGLVEAAGV